MGLPMLLCDDRKEGARPAVLEAAQARSIPTQVLTLPSADYAVYYEDDISLGIERKELGDLLNALRNGRLPAQLAKLMSSYTVPVLLLEGSIKEDRNGKIELHHLQSGWKAQSIHSFLMGIQEQGVRLAIADSVKTSAQRIVGMYQYYGKTAHRTLRDDPLGFRFQMADPGVQVLCALPGIGPEMAKAMLDKFGSVYNIITANILELQTIPGIGPQRAKTVWDTVHKLHNVGVEVEAA